MCGDKEIFGGERKRRGSGRGSGFRGELGRERTTRKFWMQSRKTSNRVGANKETNPPFGWRREVKGKKHCGCARSRQQERSNDALQGRGKQEDVLGFFQGGESSDEGRSGGWGGEGGGFLEKNDWRTRGGTVLQSVLSVESPW